MHLTATGTIERYCQLSAIGVFSYVVKLYKTRLFFAIIISPMGLILLDGACLKS